MNKVNAYPPNIEQIRKVLKIIPNTVFTYGNTVYAPGINYPLPPDLIAHEEVHQAQQMKFLTPDEWWERYLQDTTFRFEQELEAYRAQYQNFRKYTGRQEYRRFVRKIAKDLSSVMYGNIVDFTNALELIKS